jgi:hypothetical protein
MSGAPSRRERTSLPGASTGIERVQGCLRAWVPPAPTMWILVLVGTQSFPAPVQQRICQAVQALTFSDTSDSGYLAACRRARVCTRVDGGRQGSS